MLAEIKTPFKVSISEHCAHLHTSIISAPERRPEEQSSRSFLAMQGTLGWPRLPELCLIHHNGYSLYQKVMFIKKKSPKTEQVVLLSTEEKHIAHNAKSSNIVLGELTNCLFVISQSYLPAGKSGQANKTYTRELKQRVVSVNIYNEPEV